MYSFQSYVTPSACTWLATKVIYFNFSNFSIKSLIYLLDLQVDIKKLLKRCSNVTNFSSIFPGPLLVSDFCVLFPPFFGAIGNNNKIPNGNIGGGEPISCRKWNVTVLVVGNDAIVVGLMNVDSNKSMSISLLAYWANCLSGIHLAMCRVHIHFDYFVFINRWQHNILFSIVCVFVSVWDCCANMVHTIYRWHIYFIGDFCSIAIYLLGYKKDKWRIKCI